VRETTLQTPRSVEKEGEEMLQVPGKRFPCNPWRTQGPVLEQPVPEGLHPVEDDPGWTSS